MRRARPSAIAVLPTPASPTNSGLFFWRRQSTWMVRWISALRPISGSILPSLRLLVEVDAIGFERVALLLRLVARLGVGLLLGAAHRPRLGQAGPLGDAMADVVDRVVAGHVLLLQEIGGVALALGENRHQHVGAGHFLAAVDCTWITARWITRWNPAVGLESSAPSVIRFSSSDSR